MTKKAAGAADETQEIDYRSCDTIQIRIPLPERPSVWSEIKRLARPAWVYFVDHVFPAIVGVILGTGLAAGFLLLVLMWWIG